VGRWTLIAEAAYEAFCKRLDLEQHGPGEEWSVLPPGVQAAWEAAVEAAAVATSKAVLPRSKSNAVLERAVKRLTISQRNHVYALAVRTSWHTSSVPRRSTLNALRLLGFVYVHNDRAMLTAKGRAAHELLKKTDHYPSVRARRMAGQPIVVAQPVAGCDGSGEYFDDPTREDGRGAKRPVRCPGCRACS
jgi:hypothetical protein